MPQNFPKYCAIIIKINYITTKYSISSIKNLITLAVKVITDKNISVTFSIVQNITETVYDSTNINA